MQVSIAILSYNHPRITARCIQSVLRHFPSQQTLLIHNGSQNQHVTFLKQTFPQIRHYEMKNNLGYSGGVNFALRQGFKESDWVFLLTNDTEVENWQLNLHYLKAGIYSPLVWQKNKKSVDYIGGIFDSGRGRLKHIKELKKIESGLKYVPGTAFLMHKSVFEKVGRMDERLHTYWEDVDFGARASKLGIYFGYIPSLEITHQGGRTTRKDQFYTRYLFRRNRILVSWRYCPWYLKPYLLWILLPDIWRIFIFASVNNQSNIARLGHSRH